ncbi:MAG: shikimate kinase, partial [Thermoplasmata archaeon]|nr:shikimate kinase [Thermoplasmata archaeon]
HSDTSTTRRFLEHLLQDGAPSAGMDLTVRIRSEVPPSIGLKSSSALGTALVLALADARGASVSTEAAARRSAEIARAIGQSATGAFDDCMASVSSGAWITDNRTDRVLRHDRIAHGLEVVLWIPPGQHAPSTELIDRFHPAPAGPATRLALAGRTWEALESNGRAVEEALGLSPTGADDLRAVGAIAAGVTGMGPARAIVAPTNRIDAIVRHLDGRPGEVRRVGFRSGPSGGVGT